MKKRSLIVGILIVYIFLGIGCTKQERAKHFGGTVKIDLPPGQKLVIATWKESNLWYQIRLMRPEERPEVHEFIESSAYGMLEGKIVFYEH